MFKLINQNIHHLLLTIFVSFLTSSFQAYANTSSVATRAGWIESFQGVVEDYKLIRNGQAHPVSYLMPLYVGDEIIIKSPRAQLEVRLGDDQLLQINQKQSPFKVPESTGEPTLVSNFVDWAGDWFTSLHSAAIPIMTVTLISRGEQDIPPPTSGLFASDKSVQITTREPIAVGWAQGRPPFSVSLFKNTDPPELIVEDKTLLRRDHQIYTKELGEGDYSLRIADIKGQIFESTFKVVNSNDLPNPPAADIPESLPQNMQDVLKAAWLLNQNDSELYRLEAYQLLVETDYHPAVMLRNALVQNIDLPELTE